MSRIDMAQITRAMDDFGVDVLLAMSPENFFYLANSLNLSQRIIPGRLCIAVFPRDGEPYAVVCYCEQQQTAQDSWIREIQIYIEFKETPMQALARSLKERGLVASRLGIEKHFLAACHAEELAVLLPESTQVAADGLFQKIRSIKTSAEIEILTEAATCTERAILQTLQEARPGHTEKELADQLSLRILRAGATSQWRILATGVNTAVNHPYAGSKRLTPGEVMRIDTGGTFQGYQSDVARTAFVGTCSERQETVYRYLRETQEATINAARPGARACDVFNTFKEALRERGLTPTSQAVGHGLGVGLHEFPILHAAETAFIEPGMVLNVEPAVKDAQGHLYHIEDLVLVTNHEPRTLTNLRDMQEPFIVE